jgi:hypothetical protein
MLIDPDELVHDLDRIEAVEKASLRLVVQAMYDFRQTAQEIFLAEKTSRTERPKMQHARPSTALGFQRFPSVYLEDGLQACALRLRSALRGQTGATRRFKSGKGQRHFGAHQDHADIDDRSADPKKEGGQYEWPPSSSVRRRRSPVFNDDNLRKIQLSRPW